MLGLVVLNRPITWLIIRFLASYQAIISQAIKSFVRLLSFPFARDQALRVFYGANLCRCTCLLTSDIVLVMDRSLTNDNQHSHRDIAGQCCTILVEFHCKNDGNNDLQKYSCISCRDLSKATIAVLMIPAIEKHSSSPVKSTCDKTKRLDARDSRSYIS